MLKKKPFLNRFTSLPFALDMLHQRRITLLSTRTWEDQNDAYFIERYRQERGLSLVAAICFSTVPETFHHWKVFSNGTSGVCIEFDKARLLSEFRTIEGARSGMVEYLLIKDLLRKRAANDLWPFLKRKAFSDEKEFRIIYQSKTDSEQAISVGIHVSCINKITLSPWLPQEVANSIRAVIHGIEGFEAVFVNHSTLINNPNWRAAI